jgi:hypothetical protein
MIRVCFTVPSIVPDSNGANLPFSPLIVRYRHEKLFIIFINYQWGGYVFSKKGINDKNNSTSELIDSTDYTTPIIINHKILTMDIIRIPKMKMAQLQTVGDSSVEICKSIPEVEPAVSQVETALTGFKEGMLKDKASAAKKKESDLIRDRLLSGFMHDVKAEQLFPYKDETEKEALTNLLNLITKYGASISRLPQHEETAVIDNLVTNVEELELAPLQSSGVLRWIPLLKEANNAFKAASQEYLTDSVRDMEEASASERAPALIDALEALYAMLFAHIRISQSESLINAYAKLEELIDSVR